jgi:hypothetical protein
MHIETKILKGGRRYLYARTNVATRNGPVHGIDTYIGSRDGLATIAEAIGHGGAPLAHWAALLVMLEAALSTGRARLTDSQAKAAAGSLKRLRVALSRWNARPFALRRLGAIIRD